MASEQALLVIDMQAGAFEGRWAMPDGDVLIRACQRAVAWARAEQALVIWVQHFEAEGALAGSGFVIDERLEPLPHEPRVLKAEPDAFSNAALPPLLLGMKRVLVAGLQSEICVRATTLSGRAAGVPMGVIADAHHTWPTTHSTADEIHDAVNRELARAGVPLLTLADLESSP